MEPQRPRVLLVAEQTNLAAMTDALKDRAELVVAHTGEEALKKVWNERFDLCIADLHIPGSSGLDLVKAIRQNHPAVGRILVSAFADTGVLVQAINQGQIFRFVPRPFTALQLQVAVDEFMRHSQKQGSDLILVADDSASGRMLVQEMLSSAGFQVETVSDGTKALATLKEKPVTVAIIDLEMPGMTGLEVIMEGRTVAPEVPFIISSAHVQHQIALDCMASGAFDFVPKPFSREVLLFRVKRALAERRKADELLALRASRPSTSTHLIAQSPAMRHIVNKTPSLAASEETVLITGETGSGKEALAREIHRLSRRSAEQFFAVNCGALTETLLESELFGHEKGAFTGAVARRKGLFEMAHGGTLFLDELGEMSASTQVKLLRVLEERKFVRVGGTQPVEVDVRLIAATNSDLKQMVEAKTFRADLYYRLLVLPVHLPPLRERVEDIPGLIQLALERAAPGRPLSLSPAALAEATGYRWPGNVRELINAVARAVALTQSDRIETLWLDVAPPSAAATGASPSNARPLREHMADAEREYLQRLLQLTNGSLTAAAELAQVDRKSIYNKMKTYGLTKEGFK